jgi:hypothetical protein
MNKEAPWSRTGLLLKKKPFWPFIPGLPNGAFWLFHVNQESGARIGERYYPPGSCVLFRKRASLMGKVINFKESKGSTPDNLISSRPWEFRRADWQSGHFIQMLRSQSGVLEKHRKEVYENGDGRVYHLPPHFVLSGSMAFTIQGLFRYRENEEKMRQVYYLAGLIDCMIHQVTPVLRTEAIKEMYRKITTLKALLGMNWYGSMDQVLFPLDAQFHEETEYRGSLARASTMKELYSLIKGGAEEMFEILSHEYTFYAPGRGI